MAKFIKDSELVWELDRILETATSQIILISPYIKLHERYLSTLKTHLENELIEITVVFGKNEENLSRSMRLEDLAFFCQFKNIQIRYERRLHAKYYANESRAIVTSMNLYEHSQDKNIEVGILTETTLVNNLVKSVTGADNIDAQAWSYFDKVIEQSELLYHKVPQFESGLFGLTKKYTGSEIKLNRLDAFFETKESKRISINRNSVSGYCIRTGVKIPFNISQPMSADAFDELSRQRNISGNENFCHYSGEPSNGETSFAKPILRKNWRKAKERHGF